MSSLIGKRLVYQELPNFVNIIPRHYYIARSYVSSNPLSLALTNEEKFGHDLYNIHLKKNLYMHWFFSIRHKITLHVSLHLFIINIKSRDINFLSFWVTFWISVKFFIYRTLNWDKSFFLVSSSILRSF